MQADQWSEAEAVTHLGLQVGVEEEVAVLINGEHISISSKLPGQIEEEIQTIYFC